MPGRTEASRPAAKMVRLPMGMRARNLLERFTGSELKAVNKKSEALFGMFQTNPPARGVPEMLKAYNTMPWLRAVTDKISSSLATMTWRVYTKTKPVNEKGGREVLPAVQLQSMGMLERRAEFARLKSAGQLVEIEDHPMIDALYNEGINFTGVTMRELTQKYLDLVGEAFWVKQRDPSTGMPISFAPIPPQWVGATPRPDKPEFEITTPNASPTTVREEDMIWFYHPDPYNPYLRGSGMGVTLADELETDEYAAKFMKQFFYNSARPDVLISSNELKREDTRRLEQKWIEKLRGWRNSFLPFFLNRGVEVHRIGTDYGHLQMLDLRRSERDTIIQVYGTPPEVLGIVEASNRATAEVSEYLFAKWVLVPRLEFIRHILQFRLVPDYDEKLILDYDSPISQDKDHILKVATIAPWSLSLDEWRDMQGLLPLDDGAGLVYMKPLNYELLTLDDLKNPPDPDEEDENSGNEMDGETDQNDDDDSEENPDEENVDESVAEIVSRSKATATTTRESQLTNALVRLVSELEDAASMRAPEIADEIEQDNWGVASQIVMNDGAFSRGIADAHSSMTYAYVSAGLLATKKFEAILGDEVEEQIKNSFLLDMKEAIARCELDVWESLETKLGWWADKIASSPETNAADLAEDLVAALGVDEGSTELTSRPWAARTANHLITHLANVGQEAIWSQAVEEGLIDPKKFARQWVPRLGCKGKSQPCGLLHNTCARINGAWESFNGDILKSPTEAHLSCHCTEQLVRKEVQDEEVH